MPEPSLWQGCGQLSYHRLTPGDLPHQGGEGWSGVEPGREGTVGTCRGAACRHASAFSHGGYPQAPSPEV